jgi:AraC-like DNA-binding protein
MDHPRARVETIRFDRTKYGRRLLADAGELDTEFPDLIKTPDPHRLTFHEIALVTDGRGALELDGTALDVAPYRLCITAPGETRRWRLRNARLGGYLAFFEAELFSEFFADPAFLDTFPLLTMDASRRSIPLSRARFERLASIVVAMRDELSAVQPDSAHVLRAQAYLLLAELQRGAGDARPAPIDRSRVLAQRFAARVEERFVHGDGVADYAAAFGVTARHLNHSVRAATGATASEVIHRRVHLEARRLLLNTDLGIADIAQRLNFSDASYFNRFFARHAGTTPRAFRVAHGSPIFSPIRALRRARR